MSGHPPQQPVDVPLDAPLYNATIGQAFVRFWRKYVTFSGRASRSEYWWWALISFVVSIVLGIINRIIVGFPSVTYRPGESFTDLYKRSLLDGLQGSVIPDIWALITLVGGLALIVRRLHDTNRSGWWYFISWVPLVGWIIMIVFMVLPPDPAGARFDRRTATGPAS
jgi:uncharacterized membrane protein YhaH (DUF805 family)